MRTLNGKHRTGNVLFIALLAMLMALPQALNAQSNIMYGASRNPLMNTANPAFFPSHSRVYLALPGVNLDFSSPLSYSSIFQYDTAEQKTYINANSLLDTLANGEKIRFGTNIHAFGLGLNFNNFFITLSAQAKADIGFGLPNGLVTFLNEGNYNHVGDDAIELLDGNLVNVRLYDEFALGIGVRLLDDHLTVGFRAKVLNGYLDVSNAGSSLTLTTSPDYSTMTADMNLDMNYAGAIDFVYDSAQGKYTYNITNYLTNNYGVNFDLGVRYENDFLEASASIIDLGPGIHWNDNIKKIVSARENNTFTFTGMDVSTIMQGGTLDSTYSQMLIDSLKSLAEYKFVDGGEDYWTSIPTKVNVGGMFKLTPGVSAGLLFHGEFERGLVKVGEVFQNKTVGFYSRTSLLARVNIHDWVEVVAAASVLSSNGSWSWLNPGVGLTLTPFRTLQVYTFLDYISNIYLVDAKHLNVSVGLNLFLGSSSER
ncbi:MAG: hypothetical protein J6T88_09165 [Bacteroidales bacterium]|nr:hypothetical protein [Bacteroidales bacterium]